MAGKASSTPVSIRGRGITNQVSALREESLPSEGPSYAPITQVGSKDGAALRVRFGGLANVDLGEALFPGRSFGDLSTFMFEKRGVADKLVSW